MKRHNVIQTLAKQLQNKGSKKKKKDKRRVSSRMNATKPKDHPRRGRGRRGGRSLVFTEAGDIYT